LNRSIAYRLTDGKKNYLQPPRVKLGRINKAESKKCLLTIKEVFERRKITFWLLCGTMLGAVRDGDFIESDRDIDLGLYAVEKENIYEALLELQEGGFEVYRATADDSFVQVRRGGIYVDLCLMSKWDGARWRCGSYYEPKDYFTNLKPVRFLGTSFLVPGRANEYLSNRYGENWEIKNPNYRRKKNFQRLRIR